MEAKEVLKCWHNRSEFSLRKAMFSADFHERRFHQKGIVYQMPFRPLLKFCYMMCFRLAFMDGKPGTAYAFLQSIYEYFIVLKTRELMVESSIQRPAPEENCSG